MSGDRNASMPVLLLGGVIVAALLVIGYFVWTGVRSPTAHIPNKEVHPGMYDFREEARKGNIGRRPE